MKLQMIAQDRSANGYLVKTRYACPCGRGYIEEE